jgi:aryl-alcohol dehydrogenase-like predicted oxidoreductase
MTEVISGHITPEESKSFAERVIREKGVHPDHFRRFKAHTLTSLGLGTYLGEVDAETDRLVEEAIYRSVSSGAVNVIDTAINYRFQKAERSVGRALKRLISEGIINRDACFICTKNGYLTSDADLPIDFWDYIHRELIKSGKLKPEDIVGDAHAMSLSYLRDQFERSLRNLGLECVDLLYLHNAPESWLKEIGLRRFLERLEEVFAYYEEERKRGRLMFYGLATWSCFRVSRDDPEHLNLDDIAEVARNVGGEEHGFRFIQLPFNIAMSEALFLRNQRIADEPLTIFEAADKLGVGVFTSAPLAEGRLMHNTRVPEIENSRILSLLQFARSAHISIIATLVGHKQPKHFEENLKLASIPPFTTEEFNRFYSSFVKTTH